MTTQLAKNIIWTDETSSTSDLVTKYPPNTICIAKQQKQGRGRNKKTWFSEQGNLFFSIKSESTNDPFLPIVLGVALQRSLLLIDSVGINPRIFLKWPNDILDSDLKKFAGILVENNFKHEIIGIGINFLALELDNNDNYGFFKISTDPLFFLQLFINNLSKEIRESKKNVIEYWKENSVYSQNTQIKVELQDKLITGYFKDIAYDGSLLIEDSQTKQLINIYSGNVVSCRSI